MSDEVKIGDMVHLKGQPRPIMKVVAIAKSKSEMDTGLGVDPSHQVTISCCWNDDGMINELRCSPCQLTKIVCIDEDYGNYKPGDIIIVTSSISPHVGTMMKVIQAAEVTSSVYSKNPQQLLTCEFYDNKMNKDDRISIRSEYVKKVSDQPETPKVSDIANSFSKESKKNNAVFNVGDLVRDVYKDRVMKVEAVESVKDIANTKQYPYIYFSPQELVITCSWEEECGTKKSASFVLERLEKLAAGTTFSRGVPKKNDSTFNISDKLSVKPLAIAYANPSSKLLTWFDNKGKELGYVDKDGTVHVNSPQDLPTKEPVESFRLWNDNGVLKISKGNPNPWQWFSPAGKSSSPNKNGRVYQPYDGPLGSPSLNALYDFKKAVEKSTKEKAKLETDSKDQPLASYKRDYRGPIARQIFPSLHYGKASIIPTEKLIVKTNGNVSIGNATEPNATLHVKADDRVLQELNDENFQPEVDHIEVNVVVENPVDHIKLEMSVAKEGEWGNKSNKVDLPPISPELRKRVEEAKKRIEDSIQATMQRKIYEKPIEWDSIKDTTSPSKNSDAWTHPQSYCLMPPTAELLKDGDSKETLDNHKKTIEDAKAKGNSAAFGLAFQAPKKSEGLSRAFASGYIYSPYVPVIKAPVVSSSDFDPRKGPLTKYGKKLVDEGAAYYGKINFEKSSDKCEIAQHITTNYYNSDHSPRRCVFCDSRDFNHVTKDMVEHVETEFAIECNCCGLEIAYWSCGSYNPAYVDLVYQTVEENPIKADDFKTVVIKRREGWEMPISPGCNYQPVAHRSKSGWRLGWYNYQTKDWVEIKNWPFLDRYGVCAIDLKSLGFIIED